MFSPPVFITIGDEYDKRDRLPERYKGKNLKTNPPKKGSQNDALFQKQFLSLSQGDKYIDPGLYEKRARLESEKKKVTPQGFKYTNPPHKPGGSGTYFGTFQEAAPPKHEPEFAVVKKGEKPEDAKAHLKNFVTNPTRKGTYGVPGTTIGHGDEYRYVSDPFDGAKRREVLAGKESSKKIVGPAFKSSCRKVDFFDETNHGVSKVFSIDKPLPAKRPNTEGKHVPLAKAWRPGGTLVADITKYPEYQEDPYEAKEKAVREARKAEKVTVAWKPIGGPKTLNTRPIKFNPGE
ncbi:Hypothetical protein, putative [Bodo saltans]|uniref:Cilia-and flagella-associated protein 96 n=1 Tax=Bodo saltans TaxID=75058 RepID=A0A0S4IYY4_BODSA|nr:Hypothetical protein, putative [Bodo saltans]|eukprot:CUG23789.1 Hypothetical protein, putative [Bodo saltans]